MRWLEAVLTRREEEKEEADGGAIHYDSIDGVATDATWQPAPQAKAWPEEDTSWRSFAVHHSFLPSFAQHDNELLLLPLSLAPHGCHARVPPHASWVLTPVSHGWNERLQQWKENRNWDLINAALERTVSSSRIVFGGSMMGFFIYVYTGRSIFIIKNLNISEVQIF